MATGDESNLKDIFDALWEAYIFLDSTNEHSTSYVVQKRVKKAAEDAERAIQMVNILDLFSANETIEEVASNEIRYLLLSALLGYFTLKIVQQDRLELVKRAKCFYEDYLRLCRDYELTTVEIPPDEDEEAEAANKVQSAAVSRAASETSRSAKIARFKEQKATETRLAELYPLVQAEHVDDETKREYYLTLVKKWISFCIEELDSIKTEIEILEHMAKMRKEGKDLKAEAPEKPKKPTRPFIITRDKVQKEVFGLGYPSVPTYTLDEFYDRQVELGHIKPGQGQPQPPGAAELEAEDVAKEHLVDQDDPDTLNKAREWDEWRDDHRRGWGNTHNKG